MSRIVFLHPDLGIGGAERLVVDAALALKNRGHEVSFVTNHHDPYHSFQETNDGTLPVQVVGDWISRHLFGRFYAVCAYFRLVYAALYASFFLARREKIDVFICDQISVGIPILRLAKNKPKIIFYCHFPDQKLSRPEGILKKIYRAPINLVEELTIGMADTTLVNSKFTLRVFQDTFRRLNIVPEVLYPSLNTKYFDNMLEKIENQNMKLPLPKNMPKNAFVFLDINRYERKKNHALAINAFKLLADALPAADFKRCFLIVAGGYDCRVTENIEYHEELNHLLEKLDLEQNAVLLCSPNDDEKFALLHAAKCLIYTPENEHFGIVPLEGMYMSKPVIAVNSGGPTETIVNNTTGFLCENTPGNFVQAMLKLFQDDAERVRMGALGRTRVQQKFSFDAFTDKLDTIVREILPQSHVAAKKKN